MAKIEIHEGGKVAASYTIEDEEAKRLQQEFDTWCKTGLPKGGEYKAQSIGTLLLSFDSMGIFLLKFFENSSNTYASQDMPSSGTPRR